MHESWREILRINYKEFEPIDWELQWNEEIGGFWDVSP
jgi:hypothetical protein